jgi:hypothetical protein
MLFSLLIISGTIGINLLARLLLIDFWRCILFLIHIGPGAQRQFQCTKLLIDKNAIIKTIMLDAIKVPAPYQKENY